MIDHLDHIMAIMEAAFDPQWGEAWTRRQVSDSLALPNTHYRLIAADGSDVIHNSKAAGFSLVRAAPGEEELLLIAVDPRHRKKGLGSALLDYFARDARNRGANHIFLEMRANNPVEKLYRTSGFEPIGRRINYYTTPDGTKLDAITFSRSI